MLEDRLRKAREARGWTQSQLGAKLNVSDATISRYEKGLRYPDLETLKRLALVLETSVDYLVGEKPGDPDEELPPEARRCLEEFRSFLRHKYLSKD
ncbi:MAG: helix-turn-helix transcriptional regulator [Candidatus Desulforudis sp.]|nr:helix-turn-helix transcriptional regulator [Desulforudis sp.]